MPSPRTHKASRGPRLQLLLLFSLSPTLQGLVSRGGSKPCIEANMSHGFEKKKILSLLGYLGTRLILNQDERLSPAAAVTIHLSDPFEYTNICRSFPVRLAYRVCRDEEGAYTSWLRLENPSAVRKPEKGGGEGGQLGLGRGGRTVPTG